MQFINELVTLKVWFVGYF